MTADYRSRKVTGSTLRARMGVAHTRARPPRLSKGGGLASWVRLSEGSIPRAKMGPVWSELSRSLRILHVNLTATFTPKGLAPTAALATHWPPPSTGGDVRSALNDTQHAGARTVAEDTWVPVRGALGCVCAAWGSVGLPDVLARSRLFVPGCPLFGSVCTGGTGCGVLWPMACVGECGGTGPSATVVVRLERHVPVLLTWCDTASGARRAAACQAVALSVPRCPPSTHDHVRARRPRSCCQAPRYEPNRSGGGRALGSICCTEAEAAVNDRVSGSGGAAGSAYAWCRCPMEWPLQAVRGGARPHIHCPRNDSIRSQISLAHQHKVVQGERNGSIAMCSARRRSIHSTQIHEQKIRASCHNSVAEQAEHNLATSTTPQARKRRDEEKRRC